ncbi:MAG: hypothetical protein AAGJ87_02360 [Pseudomonadota bacterium]
MLSTARVDIPSPIETRLKKSSEFVDNIMEFTREDLIGFRRPLAATFAFTAPIVIALVYNAAGFIPMFKLASCYFLVAAGGLYLVGRDQWPDLVQEFEVRTREKKRAVADLKCGFTESSFLSMARAPWFVEHENGVLIFADSGHGTTLFFSVEAGDLDPRWKVYAEGGLSRRIWRWMRLPVSREIIAFKTEGTKLPLCHERHAIRSVDIWDAVMIFLGEPLDGSILHRSFDEVVEGVERML